MAELKIATAATELGVPVLSPLSEHGRYDLAFEIGGRLLRVQCKHGCLDADAGVIKISLVSNWYSASHLAEALGAPERPACVH